MSGWYSRPFSGPQELPQQQRHGTIPNQPREIRNQDQLPPRSYQRPANNTGPIILGSNHPQLHPTFPRFQHAPSVDMPPYRPPHSDALYQQQTVTRPSYHVPPHPSRHMPQEWHVPANNPQIPPNTNHQSALADPMQPPELPPKNPSGLQPPSEPQRNPPPPPLPARPTPQLTAEPSPPRGDPISSEKKPTSGRLNGIDPNLSDQLDDLRKDPVATSERFRKVAEALSIWPKKYEAGLQSKNKKLQESVTNAQHDLAILKEELHKARSSLSASQTSSHVLKGQLQILEQENLILKRDNQGKTDPGEPDYNNEETQLLIADLRSQIVKLKSEVPDPNLFESLRLIIQLLQEDKKALEKKYTEVSDELHNRDNEISRLMKENESNGNLIPEGKTGLEKHYSFQLEDLRRQNQSLSQQLEIAQHKLEVNERRESAENDPGPSRVELMNMIQHANGFQEQLQGKMREREEEIKQLKIRLENSMEVMSSSSTRNVCDLNSPPPSHGNTISSDTDSKQKEQILALEIGKQHLEAELTEARKSSGRGDSSQMESLRGEKGRLENELRVYEQMLEQKEAKIRQLQASTKDNKHDSEKDELIQTLLVEKKSLNQEIENQKQQQDELASMRDSLNLMRNWLEGRDAHIQILNDSIQKKNQEVAHYKKQYEQFHLRSNQLLDYGKEVNSDKVQLEVVVHKYKQRIEELEAKLSSHQSHVPNLSTAKEVYDVHVTQLNKDLEVCEAKKKEAEDGYVEMLSRNEKLNQEFKDLSAENARLKNDSYLTSRYGLAYQNQHQYAHESPARYPISYPAPRPQGPGRGDAQGHDPGVPYYH